VSIPTLADASAHAELQKPETVTAPLAQKAVATAPAPPHAKHVRWKCGSPRPIDDAGLSPTQWVGLGAIGAGVVGLGVGTFFTARALSWNRDSNKGCIGDVCTAAARQERLDAHSAGNAATAAFITARDSPRSGSACTYWASARRLRPASARVIWAVPVATSHEVGGSVHGTF